MTEAWRCRKFEFGLKQELKEVVIPMSIRDFLALVEKAKVVESLKSSSRLAKPQVGGPSRSTPKYEDKKKPYSRSQYFRSGGPTSQLLLNVKCFRCGGKHIVKFFPHSVSNVTCDRCHRYGHATKDCRARLPVPNITGMRQNNNQKPRTVGKVFAINGAEASQSDSLVRAICSILGTQLSVLFDSGATHSFISFDCAKKLKLPVRELEFELVISTTTEGIIVTSSMCAECSVIIDGQRYKINIICIPLKDLEVILGMDWLSANHILIDCGRKKLIFPGLEGMQVFSAHQFEREIQ